MAHKTLVGGTAYEISGGKTLIDNTAYEIDKGKTLVGGTAYEVGFGVELTITFKTFGTPQDTEHLRMEINGQTITASANEILSVSAGTKIIFYMSTPKGSGQVNLNGELVLTVKPGSEYTYEYYVNTNIELVLSCMTVMGQTSPIVNIIEQ